MDQGIIENLKRHYKKLLLRRRLDAIDDGSEFKFDLFDALQTVGNAWERVTQATIRNYFRKAHFIEEVGHSLMRSVHTNHLGNSRGSR